jgi:hypothetical protein
MDKPYDDFERRLDTLIAQLSISLQAMDNVPKSLLTHQKALQAVLEDFRGLKRDRLLLQTNLVNSYGGRVSPDAEV